MKRHSSFWLVLIFGALLAVTGCSGDDGDSNNDDNDASADAGPDRTQGDGTATDGDDDSTTNTCGDAVACRGNGDCSAEEFCNLGCCTARTVNPVCAQSGQECQDASWSNDTFACAVPEGGGVGECLARCDTNSTSSSDDNGCPTSFYCFDSGEEITNPTTGAVLDGACFEGDCNDSCFAVGGDCTAEDLFQCTSGSGTCFGVGNGASFCVEAGTQGDGEECSGSLQGEAGELCAAGLFCFNGVCETPCAYDDGDPAGSCDSGECLPVFDSSGDNSPGVCGDPCEAYESDACSDGFACAPNLGMFSRSVTMWSCTEQTSDTEVGHGEECDPTGADSVCSEGLQCIPQVDDDTIGHCEQLCDPALETTEGFGACPSGPAGVLFDGEDAVAEDDGSGFMTIDAQNFGSNGLYATATDGDVASTSADFADGTASTVIAYVSSWTEGEGEADDVLEYALASFEDVDGDTTALGDDMGQLWLYNLLDIAVVIGEAWDWSSDFDGAESSSDWEDVSDVAAEWIEFDDDGVWTALDLPTTDADAEYASYDVFVTGNDTDGFASAWFGSDVTAPTGDDMVVRVLNLTADQLVVAWDDNDTDEADHTIESGDAGAWFTIDTTEIESELDYTLDGDAGDYDSPTAGDELTIVVYGANDTYSLEGVDAPAAEMVAVRASNLTAGAIDYVLGVPFADTIEAGTAWSSDDLDAGDAWLIVFAADAADGDEATAHVETTVAEDTVSSGILTLDEDGMVEFGGVDSDWPDTDGLSDGEALVRFRNHAYGAGDLELTFPGVSLEVCVDLGIFGLEDGVLGRCQRECGPYPGGAFAHDDGASNDRWMDNGCPHTDDIIYGCLGYLTTNDNSVTAPSEGHPDVTGFCIPREASVATGNFGGTCEGDATCNPDAFCVPFSDTTSFCSKLGFPYAGVDGDSDCGDDQYCAGTLGQSICVCVDAVVEGGEGTQCNETDEFQPCADNDTLCFPRQSGPALCTRLCQIGVDGQCSDGMSCGGRGTVINDALDPSWVGLCL